MNAQRTDVPDLPPESATARRVKTILGYLFAAACLAWVVYHVHPRHLMHGIMRLDWPFLLVAAAVDNSSYFVQAVRWRLLLRPVAPVTLGHTVRGIYIGLFTSDVFPMRFGELVRAHLLSRWYSTSLSEIIPSMVVERMFEGLWLAAGIGAATLVLPLPSYVDRGAEVFGGLVVVLMALVLYAVFREEKALEAGLPLPVEKPGRIRFFIKEVAIGLKKIGLSRLFYLALAASLASLILQALAVSFVIHAYGLRIEVWQAAVVFLVIRLGIVIPGAPANIGTYQFFAALGLRLFGIGRSVAGEFSFVLFFVLGVPVWVAGFVALSRSGISLFRLRCEAQEAMRR